MNRNNQSFNNNQFLYRPFKWEDLSQLKILQNHLFPVQYFDNFYKRLLNESFVTVLVWYKPVTHIDNEKNRVMIDGKYNVNNDDIMIDSGSSDGLQIEFREPLNNGCSSVGGGGGGGEEFINSKYELIGVATGRITKDQGICSLFYQNYDSYLMTFGIKEQFRSKGVGSELLNNICKLFYKRGCDKVYLHVKKGNNGAYMFYIKNGFMLDDEIVNYYKIDNIRYNALSMSKDLRPKERRSNWHSFVSLLKQNQNLDDDDEYDEINNSHEVNIRDNLITGFNGNDQLLNRKRFNFIFILIIFIFLIISLSLIAINNNNYNENKIIQ
ncbi:hypothetical protein RB653_009014 [Dictyostelium firmibasis]|uniref:N-alpha-acetyltransferase 60 n=1 Tax=Dictyostelium firmibasis TaxID=79012 RepID=A0AAN7TSW1_9MYCE